MQRGAATIGLLIWISVSARAHAEDAGAAGAGGAAGDAEPRAALTLRGGLYADSDETTVVRSVASARLVLGRVDVVLSEAVDVVSSASTDVRTSPAIDAVSGASAVAPRMRDRRFLTGLSLGYASGDGVSAKLSPFLALESDYRSAGAGVQGAWEVAGRNTTLLAGATFAHDAVRSALDPAYAGEVLALGAAAGVVQVLSPTQLVELRYDAAVKDGDLGSPYRAVRFGDWRTAPTAAGGLVFVHTIGPAEGLPERLPGRRWRHAVSAGWLGELRRDLGLRATYRLGLDDWGLVAHAAGAELRWRLGERWVVLAAYRYYHQGGADFWRGKYVLDPGAYAYFSADKELGEVRGHDGGVSLSWRLPPSVGRLVSGSFDVDAHVVRYAYPGFALLERRDGLVVDVGLVLEL